jgi:uncharacterized membrane protein YgdD (TMEM256/DUF423 family)
MTETEENVQVSGIDSKFMKVTLTLVTVILLFVGPTYIPYVMNEANINFLVTDAVGGVLFLLGIVMLIYLVRKKVIS